MNVLTFTPMRLGVLLKTGIIPGSAEFKAFLESLPRTQSEVIYPSDKDDDALRYTKLENDSYDLRILIWEQHRNAAKTEEEHYSLRVHLYGNNVAIAEVEFFNVSLLPSDDMEVWCQQETKIALEREFPLFNNFLKEHVLTASDYLEEASENALQLSEDKPDFNRMSRALLISEEERKDPKMQATYIPWLRNTLKPEQGQEIADGATDSAMTWVNYVLVNDDIKRVQVSISAMRVAQYFWSAQEWFNANAHDSITQAMNDRKIARAEKQLRAARSRMQMLKIQYNEACAHMNRQRQTLMKKFLDDWGFEKLIETGDLLIDLSSNQLDEIAERNKQTNSAVTDILLVGLSFFALLEVLLYILEFSRELQLRPSLSLRDSQASRILTFISSIDIDNVLLISMIAMGVLFFVYVFVFLVTRRFR